MGLFHNIEPLIADKHFREVLHAQKEDALIAAEYQAIRERIHALKVRKRMNEQLKDALAAETDREWQEEAQLTAAGEP
jgi:hypothetical protein